MPDVLDSPLTRIDGVELARVGSWDTLTGTWNPTVADFHAAVDAAACAATRKPIVKLGHLDQRFTPHTQMPTFDGTPSIGWVDNLRVDGDTLIGDMVGVPQWLSAVAASAYPSRSVEALYNRRCAAGHHHPFSLGAVALLGVTPPGVESLRGLNDIPALFGIAAGAVDLEQGELVVATIPAAVVAEAEVHTGAMVALIPTAEDAQRLAVEGGKPADQLHCTLMYLGNAADIPAAHRQDVIDWVSTATNGLPVVDAVGFALSVFNPGNTSDRDPCITLGLSGDLLDAVHSLIADAVGFASPAQHAPWHAHLTLAYTGDLTSLPTLVDRVGPVRFDKVRVTFGGDIIDIPLIDDDTGYDDDPAEVAAAKGGRGELKRYWLHTAEGLKRWAKKKHPWAALFRHLRKHMDQAMAKRVTSDWYREHFGHMPNQKSKVAAAGPPNDNGGAPPPGPTPPEPAAADPQPLTPPTPGGVPVSPGAEPEHQSEPTKGEDPVSTLSTDVRSRLGLPDDADDAAVVAALDALRTKADTPPPVATPDPELVAASAAATAAVAEYKTELARVSGELAEIKVAAAADAKRAFFDGAVAAGRISPADRPAWEARYDKAPDVIADIVGSLAANTAIPVAAAGHTGTGEETVDIDAEYKRLAASIDGPYAKKGA